MNKAAQALGRMGKGKKKTYSPEQIAVLTERLAAARAKRWPKEEAHEGLAGCCAMGLCGPEKAQAVRDQARAIDEHGIPEGCTPGTSVTYIDQEGKERFRFNMGVTTLKATEADIRRMISELL